MDRRPMLPLSAALLLLAGCAPHTEGASAPRAHALETSVAVAPPEGIHPVAGMLAEGGAEGPWFVWTESLHGTIAGALKVSRHRADGWTAPVTVTTSRVLAMTGAVPALGATRSGTRVVGYAALSPSGKEIDLLASKSDDGGRTWRPAGAIDREIGLQHEARLSFVTRPDGGLTAIWLTEVVGPLDGQVTTGVVMASQFGEGFGGRRALSSRACDRGNASIAATADGLVASWRVISPYREMDVEAIVLTGGEWGRVDGLYPDGWKERLCSRDGPVVAASGRRAWIAWFTGANEARVKVMASIDAGKRFGGMTRLSPRKKGSRPPLGGVSILAMGDSALVAWAELDREAAATAPVLPSAIALKTTGESMVVTSSLAAAAATAAPSATPELPRAIVLVAQAVDVDGARGEPLEIARIPLLDDALTMAHDGDGVLVCWEESIGTFRFARLTGR